MKQYICVYDFETDGVDPHKCEPVQLAACMIHNITLDIIEDSEFCIDMRPIDIDQEDYFSRNFQTIKWHAGNYGCTPEEIFEKWKAAPEQQQGWKQFTSYLLKYNKNQARKSKFHAPIRAGANIERFDNIIIDRLCNRYGDAAKNGEQKIFYPRDVIDITKIAFLWFENRQEPEAYNMDILRPFFGMPSEGAHDALKDIRDEAWMIQKFMRLFRRESAKIAFKGAYNNGKN